MRVFIEEQRFTQPWLIILLVVTALVPISMTIGTYLNDPNAYSLEEFVLFIVAILFVFGLIFLCKLTTRIDEQGIHYKFFPVHWKYRLIKWNEINKVYVRTYDALSEYGGWGLKGGVLWNASKGKAINVSGNIGIQLELKNSKKLLIGTKRKEEAKNILATYITKVNTNV